mmetsp:Transcript_29811/g.51462  ORF Transcript_29811/g.51462 Transcript_29811/m.51462 type:complete len:1589 (-) Transcript_29811:419-5185(-)
MLGSLYRRSSSTVVRSLGLKSGAFTARGNVINGLRSRLGHNIRQIPGRIGLYDGQQERDNCGVGLVAQLKKVQSRQIVEDANEMLVRMSHRGACGCEANTGDGAGMLVGMPDSFLRAAMAAEGVTLPPLGQYGAGNVFLPKGDAAAIERAKAIFERVARQRGLKVVGFRTVPTDNRDLGKSAVETEPHQEQVFIENAKGLAGPAFERELLRVRKLARAEAREDAALRDLYVCSLSAQTLTYKGQLTPEQVMPYFKGDLAHPDFHSHMALVHSRFSTNTFPSWDRAQPLRMMCHNGEINTLRGNKNWMHARAGIMHSPYYGDETYQLNPICGDHMSDSGNFDATLEVLAKGSERTLPEAVMMMIPEAWQDNPSISPAKRAFYEYNSCVMEPWDGPAMVAFTDGRYVGANLDRNGLRPSRYYVTKDDRVLISSEVGVVPELPDELVAVKHRLEPGKMFLVDFERGELLTDAAVKEELAASRPYQEWVADHLLDLGAWQEAARAQLPPAAGPDFATSTRRLNLFGYSTETLDMLLYPMSVGGKEALGSMGNDAPLAVLSQQPRQVFDYFKQLFAQVTNPPIDPLREGTVMSVEMNLGPRGNVRRPSEEGARALTVPSPVLNQGEMDQILASDFRTEVMPTLYDIADGPEGLAKALDALTRKAVEAVQNGCEIIVLSDKQEGGITADKTYIPPLLATGAVHHRLIDLGLRMRASIVVESAQIWGTHHFACLVGYGASAAHPYLALETTKAWLGTDKIQMQMGKGNLPQLDAEAAQKNYRDSIDGGLLKIMSKIGISCLNSYQGAQIFEGIGIGQAVLEAGFKGTPSRVGGLNLEELATETVTFHQQAFQADLKKLYNYGYVKFFRGGEYHHNSVHKELHKAIREGGEAGFDLYQLYVDEIANRPPTSLRDLLEFDLGKARSIPLDQVEPVDEIMKRFCTGGMSLGALSREAHETLGIALNRVGGKSNSGEGGEDPVRFRPILDVDEDGHSPTFPHLKGLKQGDLASSKIKQVASGRFGVTPEFIMSGEQLEIKIAQGAKPGEGGQLPGAKIDNYIASLRASTPGVTLISPPPHHDIYSIEDLAQLIHDLKNAQPTGEVSVKLVSEVGVGVIAAGVSKAKADHIVISGHDGGTGAAAWTGVKGAGLPWELGVAEAQQTLVLNDLRSRVRLQTDGQIRNGRDVVVAALLGAEEMGFATGPLIALGCIMMRKCHLNTCPVGIATQDPDLRKKFNGQPEHVINYFFLLAEEVRQYMAQMGFRTFEEMVGRTDMLEVNRDHLHYKSEGLDLSPLLVAAHELNPEHTGLVKRQEQDHGIADALDNRLIELARPALERGEPVEAALPITNLNRTVGTMLSYHITKKYGAEGLPEGTVHFKFSGHAGQSLGFAVTKGMYLEVDGDANDYVGKGLSGGKIAVYPQAASLAQGFVAEDNVIVGNVCLYGATAGKAFFRGKAGERFCVRNSGALAVVEGVGDHGCEYMTGGRTVVLGSTGRNFAAGMSGGIAYVYDPDGTFPDRCNLGLVGLEKVETDEDKAELRGYIQEHEAHTGSPVAAHMLADFEGTVQKFVKVFPHDYKRVLLERAARKGEESDGEVAA